MEQLTRGLHWLLVGVLLKLVCSALALNYPGFLRLGLLSAIPTALGLLSCARGPVAGWRAALALVGPVSEVASAVTLGDSRTNFEDVCAGGEILGYGLLLLYLISLASAILRRDLVRQGWFSLLVPPGAMFLCALNYNSYDVKSRFLSLLLVAVWAALAWYIRRLQTALKKAPVEW